MLAFALWMMILLCAWGSLFESDPVVGGALILIPLLLICMVQQYRPIPIVGRVIALLVTFISIPIFYGWQMQGQAQRMVKFYYRNTPEEYALGFALFAACFVAGLAFAIAYRLGGDTSWKYEPPDLNSRSGEN